MGRFHDIGDVVAWVHLKTRDEDYLSGVLEEKLRFEIPIVHGTSEKTNICMKFASHCITIYKPNLVQKGKHKTEALCYKF